jgi:hypothetical protein
MENLTTTKLDEDITYDVIGEYYILRIKDHCKPVCFTCLPFSIWQGICASVFELLPEEFFNMLEDEGQKLIEILGIPMELPDDGNMYDPEAIPVRNFLNKVSLTFNKTISYILICDNEIIEEKMITSEKQGRFYIVYDNKSPQDFTLAFRKGDFENPKHVMKNLIENLLQNIFKWNDEIIKKRPNLKGLLS